MKTQEFLTFRLRQLRYGLPIDCVREIFPLPEISPVPEAPGDMIGLLDWRGKVLPVMHMDRRLAQPMQPCRLTDSVIVIEWANIHVGVIVNQVEAVLPISDDLIDSNVTYGRENQINTAFLAGVAKIDFELIFLLNTDALIRLPDEVAMLIWESELNAQDAEAGSSGLPTDFDEAGFTTADHVRGLDFYASYCPDASIQERAIFAERAAALKRSHENETEATTKPVAVFGLGGEYYGMPLELIREFIDLPKINPIPCCPKHILGNLNLRGEVVTLVDIKSALNLEASQRQTPKVVITQVGQTVAGIAIDEIHDILYLREGELSAAMHRDSDWIQGVAPFNNKLVSILNLQRLLESEALSVNQAA
jgi:purine-binding chemotaxis protein CheW